jgi:hypothetical protein
LRDRVVAERRESLADEYAGAFGAGLVRLPEYRQNGRGAGLGVGPPASGPRSRPCGSGVFVGWRDVRVVLFVLPAFYATYVWFSQL